MHEQQMMILVTDRRRELVGEADRARLARAGGRRAPQPSGGRPERGPGRLGLGMLFGRTGAQERRGA